MLVTVGPDAEPLTLSLTLTLPGAKATTHLAIGCRRQNCFFFFSGGPIESHPTSCHVPVPPERQLARLCQNP